MSTASGESDAPAGVGVIGLGQMGMPMSGRLLEAGFEVRVTDADPGSRDAIERAGAVWMDTPAEVAGASEVVLIMVPSAAVEEVLLGSSGVLAGSSEHLVVIEGGNSDPAESRRFAERCSEAGVALLDVGFSGGPSGAASGELAVMAGGAPGAFARAHPVLEALGREIALLGPSGAGHLAKALNHLVVGLTSQAIGEAMSIAEASGLDPSEWLRVISKGAAASWLVDRAQEMVRTEEFPGMDEWWAGHGSRNQFTYSVEAAHDADVAVPLASLGHEVRMLSLAPPRSPAMENYVRLTWRFAHAGGKDAG